MKPHVRNYFKAFGYDESSILICECCGVPASDVHHIEPRSSFGSTRKKEQDAVDNLIALCRECHDEAHGRNSRELKREFKIIAQMRKSNLK
jgi:5-methylcytosine-specific restriction endonuclease McrA